MSTYLLYIVNLTFKEVVFNYMNKCYVNMCIVFTGQSKYDVHLDVLTQYLHSYVKPNLLNRVNYTLKAEGFTWPLNTRYKERIGKCFVNYYLQDKVNMMYT